MAVKEIFSPHCRNMLKLEEARTHSFFYLLFEKGKKKKTLKMKFEKNLL